MFFWILIGALTLSFIGHLVHLGLKEIKPRTRWCIAVDAGLCVALLIGCLLWL